MIDLPQKEEKLEVILVIHVLSGPRLTEFCGVWSKDHNFYVCVYVTWKAGAPWLCPHAALLPKMKATLAAEIFDPKCT